MCSCDILYMVGDKLRELFFSFVLTFIILYGISVVGEPGLTVPQEKFLILWGFSLCALVVLALRLL